MNVRNIKCYMTANGTVQISKGMARELQKSKDDSSLLRFISDDDVIRACMDFKTFRLVYRPSNYPKSEYDWLKLNELSDDDLCFAVYTEGSSFQGYHYSEGWIQCNPLSSLLME